MISEDDEASISVADEESVEVVIMRGQDGCGQARPLVGDSPVDLNSPEAPTPDVLADLLDSTVRLVAPTDVLLDVVDLVRQAPVPKAFQASSWLREHRVLVFRDGYCRLGSLVMRYGPQLGLAIDDAE